MSSFRECCGRTLFDGNTPQLELLTSARRAREGQVGPSNMGPMLFAVRKRVFSNLTANELCHSFSYSATRLRTFHPASLIYAAGALLLPLNIGNIHIFSFEKGTLPRLNPSPIDCRTPPPSPEVRQEALCTFCTAPQAFKNATAYIDHALKPHIDRPLTSAQTTATTLHRF